MHDTAVGSANFTECVPAPTGDGCRSPAPREGGRSPTHRVRRRPQVVGGRHRWHETSSSESRRNNRVVRARLRYDSFQYF
jgi:hypothetical protein